jgi:hypothetical protein
MKKLLYLLLALPMLLAACEKTPEPTPEPGPDGPDPELYLVSNGVQYFEAAGGEGDIEYRLENAEGQPQATTTADWITNITVVPENSTVTFFIAENKGEERKAPLTLSYGPISFDVEIVQKAAEAPTGVVFEATVFGGEYYGDYYAENAGNYYIWLADKGFDEDGYELANGTYYFVDIFAELYDGEISDFVNLPVGEYTFDATSAGVVGTFTKKYSSLVKTDEDAKITSEVFFDSGKVVITENSVTLTVVIEGVEHTVTYTGSTAVADVRVPAGEDKEFVAEHAIAYYRGDYYNPGVSNNFSLLLSDIGWDEEGWELPNGAYYILDLHTNIIEGELALPYGTYTIDVNGTLAPFTIDESCSQYYLMDDEGWDYLEEAFFKEGSVTISAEGITAELVTDSGAVHTITYEGIVENILDYSDMGGDDETYSTLIDDYRCNLDGCKLAYKNYGDFYEVGYDNWLIELIPESGPGDALTLDLITGATGTSEIAGEYTISNSLDAYTACPGWLVGDSLESSWYFNIDEEDYMVDRAPLMSGDVTITKNSDGTYTIELDAYDDLYNNITATWTGIDSGAITASVKSANMPTKGQNMKHMQRGVKHDVKSAKPFMKSRF